ncbi:MAG TPA: DUF5666 domain-containing protein [Bryobacteraceae bacterium]|nr:DUF5666 domain-containing protein [Bryobacteraceae bacterium]
MKPALLFLLLAAQVPIFSQMGGSGIPWPHRKKKEESKDQTTQRSLGKLTKVDNDSLVVEVPDGRVLTFKRTDKTQFLRDDKEIKPTELKVGDRVTVEATEDQEGYMTAVKVTLDPNPPPEESAAAPAPAEKATEARGRGEGNSPAPVDADNTEPGPPKIRRGAPARRQDADTDEDAATPAPVASNETRETREPREASEVPEAPPTDDPIIEKAKQATVAFTEKLPNYVCKEFMARYQSSRQPADWQALDVVSTDIIYEAGRESYRNIAVNGKPFSKGMEQMSGAWSTGEFGTMLLDLFAPWTAAEFHLRRRSTVAGVETRVYDFEVDHPHSHWHVQMASQSMLPAYKGSVWIEPATGKVLRLEMRARQLPERFPVDTVESAVDYDSVMIGGKKFLLPVHAETLACERGTSNCSRNAIDFRNYHKFESNSDITFAADK